MNTIDAHEIIGAAFDHDPDTIQAWLPDGVTLAPFDCICAALTAAAAISGQLDDCESLADLQAAVEHFNSLLNGEIVTTEEWVNEIRGVVAEVIEYGDSVTAHERN